MAYLYGYMAEFMDMVTGALRFLLFSTWWWGVLARYAGVRAVAFWVGALSAMFIYLALCLFIRDQFMMCSVVQLRGFVCVICMEC